MPRRLTAILGFASTVGAVAISVRLLAVFTTRPPRNRSDGTERPANPDAKTARDRQDPTDIDTTMRLYRRILNGETDIAVPQSDTALKAS